MFEWTVQWKGYVPAFVNTRLAVPPPADNPARNAARRAGVTRPGVAGPASPPPAPGGGGCRGRVARRPARAMRLTAQPGPVRFRQAVYWLHSAACPDLLSCVRR